ncbi:transposase [Halovulum sp. GXIMD14793]
MAGKKVQKKRFWSDDEKRSICAQTWVPGVSVAQVARRYSMNANLIHKWLRDPRFASEKEVGSAPDHDEATFLPVEIEELPTALSQQIAPPVINAAQSVLMSDRGPVGSKRSRSISLTKQMLP